MYEGTVLCLSATLGTVPVGSSERVCVSLLTSLFVCIFLLLLLLVVLLVLCLQYNFASDKPPPSQHIAVNVSLKCYHEVLG